jgi:hypothetical protein
MREGFESYRKPLIINKINNYTRKIHPKVHPSIIDCGFLLLQRGEFLPPHIETQPNSPLKKP